MSRIRKFYERRFEELLARRNVSPGVTTADLFAQAAEFTKQQHIKPSLSLAIVHADLRRTIGETEHFPHLFFCDVGLGGLTRWLRGAGYPAFWKPDLDDAAVIREAERIKATLITTDSLMTERGVLRDGHLPWIWVPSSLTCEEQLTIVLREMDLPLRESRCMNCGGALRHVDKAIVAHRIPPRTAMWLDEYFVCDDCDQLFWRGTHWKKITHELQRLRGASVKVY